PRPMEKAAGRGWGGVGAEPGGVWIVVRAEPIGFADLNNCAMEGLAQLAPAGPPRSLMGELMGELSGRVIGRRRPNRHDAADIATGLAAVARLATFTTGRSVVVVRRYVRAIEA